LTGDAVERQLAAYNAHDIAAFLACYHDDVQIVDAEGQEIMTGTSWMRQSYGPLFRDHPDLRAEILWRERLGAYVVDVELVTGLADEPVRAVAIYHLDENGLIDRIRFVR
jgi:hypothetical protein